jgi:hypothetical protein
VDQSLNLERRPSLGARTRAAGARGGGSLGLSVLNTAATLVTTIVLARLLGVVDYGSFAFVVATVALLAVPAIVGFDRLLVRDVAIHSEQRSYELARGLVRARREWCWSYRSASPWSVRPRPGSPRDARYRRSC